MNIMKSVFLFGKFIHAKPSAVKEAINIGITTAEIETVRWIDSDLNRHAPWPFSIVGPNHR
jgi:hypothetical protein